MRKNEAMYTSTIQTYETPHWLFDKLNNVFGFTIDVACLQETAKCDRYYTPKEDGLIQSWKNEICWCNPPYSKYQIKWVHKALDEYQQNGTTTVLLIPARPDTKLYQDVIFPYANCICLIRGRLKFHNCSNSAPFPSALVVFGDLNKEQFNVLQELGFIIKNS